MALLQVLNSCRYHCLALCRLGAALHASKPVGCFPGCALSCDPSSPYQVLQAGGSRTLFHPGVFFHVARRGQGGGEEVCSKGDDESGRGEGAWEHC